LAARPLSSKSSQRKHTASEELEFSLEEQILGYQRQFPGNEGEVINIEKGVVSMLGLQNAHLNSIVEMGSHGLKGYVVGLEKQVTKVAALGSPNSQVIKIGDSAKLLSGADGELKAPVYMPGRVTTPVGLDYFSRETLPCPLPAYTDAKHGAPTFLERDRVTKQLFTGIFPIDTLYPIGYGTRNALIGNNPRGLRYIALNLLARQAKLDPSKRSIDSCIWVSSGLDQSGIRRTHQDLQGLGALDFTTVIASSNSEPWAIQALAPATACAMAEDRAREGDRVLIVIDSLGPVGAALAELESARNGGKRVTSLFQPHRYLERVAPLQGKGSVTAFSLLYEDGSIESDQVRDQIAGQVDNIINMQGMHGIRAIGSRRPGVRSFQDPRFRVLAWRLQEILSDASQIQTASVVARRLGINPADEESLGSALAYAENIRALFESDVRDASLADPEDQLVALDAVAHGDLDDPMLSPAGVKPFINKLCEQARILRETKTNHEA